MTLSNLLGMSLAPI